MTAVRTLIFDLDGTLIDSSDGVVEAVNYSLSQLGEDPQPAARIKSFIGYPLKAMYPNFTDKPVEELYHHFQIRAEETVVLNSWVLPGVTEALNGLREAGFTMAIASTKIRKHIDGIVDKFEWGRYFDAWSGGDEVLRVKPYPDILVHTLERLEGRAENTLVVGDTENDVLAAHAVPLRVAAIRSPYGGEEKTLAAKPQYFLENLTELYKMLKECN